MSFLRPIDGAVAATTEARQRCHNVTSDARGGDGGARTGGLRRALEALGAEPPGDGRDRVVRAAGRRPPSAPGDYDDAVAAWEQLHRHHRSPGDRLAAARAAVMTAMFLLIDSGLMSTVRGWVRRAERLLDGHDRRRRACAHRRRAGLRAVLLRRPRAGRRARRDAVELGEPLDVMPAVAIGRTATGRIAVLDGRRRRWPRAARRGGRPADVGRCRPPDDRDDVLRADLRGAGSGPTRTAPASGPT